MIRSCFIPSEEDMVIVGGDYNGFELRIIAEFSQDPLWINTYINGGDLHSILCTETFGIDMSEIKKPFPGNPDITYRDLQKTIDFGLAYGMSEFKLSVTAGIPKNEAKDIITKFFQKVPKVKKFLDGLANLAETRGYIKTSNVYGRVRQFPKWNYLKDYPNTDSSIQFRWLGAIGRAGKNTPIQGTNADIIKQALIDAQYFIDTQGYNSKIRILLAVYDEIQTECHKDLAEMWKLKLQEIMVTAAQRVIKTIPVVADVKISNCWTK